ncbi:MAG: Hsp20/alpha crystallin family protein [Aggregatilineales bacterium]
MATIVRWNPVREIAAMQDVMDRIFEENRRGNRNSNTVNTRSLALDVHENENAYTVLTVLPGINPDTIDVRLHDNVLTISAEIAKPDVEENTRVLLSERVYGKFSRSINLPNEVDGDNVEAAYDNGVLTLTLPKVEESQPRQIPVRVNNQIASQN